MSERISWKEIEEKYHGEWVLLDDFDWPEEQPNPNAGVVILHSSERKDFDQKMREMKAVNVARLFVGKPEFAEGTVLNCSLVNIIDANH